MRRNYKALGIHTRAGQKIWASAMERCAKLHKRMLGATPSKFRQLDEQINRITVEALLKGRALNPPAKKRRQTKIIGLAAALLAGLLQMPALADTELAASVTSALFF
jgi:hypothetical protein